MSVLPGRLRAVPAEPMGEGVVYHPDHVALLGLDLPATEAWNRLHALGPCRTPDLAEDPEVLEELFQADLLRDADTPDPGRRAPEAGGVPLRSLVLNLTQNCNLACTYCYADVVPATAQRRPMDPATARAAVDFLFAESGPLPRVSLSFLGGEPLLAWSLLAEVVEYAEGAAARKGKAVNFSLTTNGTLLLPHVVGFLEEHRVAVTVSLDGPPEVHDRQRPDLAGRGSFARIEPRVRHLLATVRSRPVGARVTLTRGCGSILPIFDFLRGMGFYDVGFSPATDGRPEVHLSEDETGRLLDDFGTLTERYLAEAERGVYPGFSNLSNLLAEIHRGQARTHACGAGLGLLGTDWSGGLYLCHRFAGREPFRLGSVQRGLDREARSRLLRGLALEARPGCQECWIRHLCAGGCYHEAWARPDDSRERACEALRRWTRMGLEAYLKLHGRAPGFLEKLAGSRPDEGTTGGFR